MLKRWPILYGSGLVASSGATRSGNITGPSIVGSGADSAKGLEMLKEIVPRASPIGNPAGSLRTRPRRPWQAAQQGCRR